MRLKKVDDLTRADHYYVTEEDVCYYLGEYTSGLGYQHSPTNQLIFNLKKSVELRGTSQYVWKERAIEHYAAELRRAINWSREANRQITWVPVPPSRAKDDPKHDDRMLQILKKMTDGLGADVRELIYQETSVEPSHLSGARPKPSEIAANYRVRQELLEPKPTAIGIVDDVLTAGAHFKAMQMVLEEYFPGVRTFGLFLARTER